jgi:hypothetical protein
MPSDALGALSPAGRWPNRADPRLMPPIDFRKPSIAANEWLIVG